MFLVRFKLHNIAGMDFLDRAALALSASTAGGHDERLAERTRMPCGARTWLERDASTRSPGGGVC